MNKIPSFTINHEQLLRGIYVSRKDTVGGETVTTFDIRMKEPNREPVLHNGAIHTIDLAPGEDIIIDNGHLVAWQDTMQYDIQKSSNGWISTLKSGEGFVCRFKGPGRILLQTRNPHAFGSWLSSLLPSSD